MSEKYTPGPWSIDGESFSDYGNLIGVFVAKSGGGRVAKTFINCLVNEEACLANARLIAAAPDLHDELENCADLLNMTFPNAPVDSCIGVAIIKARAAITKVTGATA